MDFGMFIADELFTSKELIDPGILQAVKDLKKNGWDLPGIESLLSHRLKITGRNEYIETLKTQMKLIFFLLSPGVVTRAPFCDTRRKGLPGELSCSREGFFSQGLT